MKKKKTICVIDWLDTGIFEPTILFTCGYTIQEVLNHLKSVGATEWFDALSKDTNLPTSNWYALRRDLEVIKTGDKKTFFFIIIPRFDFDDPDCYVKLAHECLHICQFFLPDVLNRDREYEAEAYLHTHLMRQAIKKIQD